MKKVFITFFLLLMSFSAWSYEVDEVFKVKIASEKGDVELTVKTGTVEGYCSYMRYYQGEYQLDYKTIDSPLGLYIGDGENCAIDPSFSGVLDIPSVWKDPDGQELKFLGISNNAFSGCTNLKEIHAPAAFIGESAFYNCEKLESVSFTSISWDMESYSDYTTHNYISYPLSVGNDAFSGCFSLYSFNATVGSIGSYAFSACYSLHSIRFCEEFPSSNGGGMIGDCAFCDCNLESIEIPASFGKDAINEQSFYGCTITGTISVAEDNPYYDSRDNCNAIIMKNHYSLGDNVLIKGNALTVIPDGVKYINKFAFENEGWPSKTTIPSSVEVIDSYAFKGCKGIFDDTFVVPHSVRIMGEGVFDSCEALTSVDLEIDMDVIPDNSFFGCKQLKSVVLPSSVVEIKGSAFLDCSNLSAINIPKGLKTIGERAFYNCSSLSSINFPEGIKTIGGSAFFGCENLKEIHLPASLEYFGVYIGEDGPWVDENMNVLYDNPFSYCSSLETIMIDQANPFFDSRTKCNAIIESSTNRLLLGCVNTKIPNGVLTIGENAFSGCYGLIAISSRMQSDAIIIPSTVKTIGENAFRKCFNLKSVELPEGVEIIEDDAFSSTFSLESLSLPSTITYIGNSAFGEGYGYVIDDEEGAHDLIKLRSVVYHAKKPVSIDYDTFCYTFKYYYKEPINDVIGWRATYNDIYEYATLYVPQGTVEEYKNTKAWSSFKNIVEIGGDDISSINGVCTENNCHLQKEVYSVEGRKQRQLSHGLNIVRMMDGSVKKVFIK